MRNPRNTALTEYAKELRRNMTKEERHLWYDCLRYYHPKFRRQHIIGNYIADFYCDQARLIIELDGSQHFESSKIVYDTIRTNYFSSLGIDVLRYSNSDINTNFEGVCQHIHDMMLRKGIHPSVTFGDSSPQGEP